MAARRNRPDKYGSGVPKTGKLSEKEQAAALYIYGKVLENPGDPRMEHYTPWDYVSACDQFVKLGYLREGMGRGCYGKGPKWDELVLRIKASGADELAARRAVQ